MLSQFISVIYLSFSFFCCQDLEGIKHNYSKYIFCIYHSLTFLNIGLQTETCKCTFNKSKEEGIENSEHIWAEE